MGYQNKFYSLGILLAGKLVTCHVVGHSFRAQVIKAYSGHDFLHINECKTKIT
jgi:hypothetical protein